MLGTAHIRSLIAAAAVLVPTAAHADFAAHRSGDIRTAAATPAPALTVDDMLSKIHTVYMTGVQRCYDKALAEDASLSGKITVTLTVSPFGHVWGTAEGIAPKVDACVATQVTKWKFASPRDAKNRPAEQTFRLSLKLSR